MEQAPLGRFCPPLRGRQMDQRRLGVKTYDVHHASITWMVVFMRHKTSVRTPLLPKNQLTIRLESPRRNGIIDQETAI